MSVRGDNQSNTGANKDFYRNMVDDVRRKLAELARDSEIRLALPDHEIEKISEAVESEHIEDLHGRFYPPLFLLVRALHPSHIHDLEGDIELVLSRTDPARHKEALAFLRELEEDRKFRAGLFEIYAKSRLSKADDADVTLDALLPNECNADIRLSFGEREFYLECTILSESDEDRQRLCEQRNNHSSSKFWPSNIPRESGRFFKKVYDKLAREWDPKKSQLSDAHPNVLLISLFGQYRSAFIKNLTLALEELFSERIGKPEDEQAQQPERTSLRAWLYYAACEDRHSRKRLTKAEYKERYLDLLKPRKKIGAILLFHDCELRDSRVNYSATHRITHSEMARLEELFRSPPRWI